MVEQNADSKQVKHFSTQHELWRNTTIIIRNSSIFFLPLNMFLYNFEKSNYFLKRIFILSLISEILPKKKSKRGIGTAFITSIRVRLQQGLH